MLDIVMVGIGRTSGVHRERNFAKMRNQIREIIIRLGIADKFLTFNPTYEYEHDHGLCCCSMSEGKNPYSSYLMVFDTDEEEGMRVATALNEELDVRVNVIIVHACLLPKK